MEKIGSLLSAAALTKWAKDTDKNFGVDTFEKLQEARSAFANFMDEMDKAA